MAHPLENSVTLSIRNLQKCTPLTHYVYLQKL